MASSCLSNADSLRTTCGIAAWEYGPKPKWLLNLISLFGVMLLHIITLWIVLCFIEEERGEQKNWPQLGEINWTTSYVWLILCLFSCPSWFIWVVKQIWRWSDFFYHTIEYKYQWWAAGFECLALALLDCIILWLQRSANLVVLICIIIITPILLDRCRDGLT